MDKQEAELFKKMIKSLEKMTYYSKEISELIQCGFDMEDLRKIQKLMEDHRSSRIDELEYHMRIFENPKLQRLGILLRSYIESAHCPVCASILLTSAFMAKLILDFQSQGQQLQ